MSGGIWVVSQIIQTLMTQNWTHLTQNNIPKLLMLKIDYYLQRASRCWTQTDCGVIFPMEG